jgi:hypothetical protein
MMLVNVTFRDCIAAGNSGFGWILSPQMLNASSRDLSIAVENMTITGGATPPPKDAAHPAWRPGMGIGITGVNEAGVMRKGWGTGALSGSIAISNSTVRDTWGCGLFVTSKGSHAASLLLSDVKFENVQRQPAGTHCPAPVSKSCPPPGGSYAVPIEVGGNSNSCFETGGIRFANCSVVDSYDRSFITMNNIAGLCPKTKSGNWALANITGGITVTNEFGCRYSKPPNGSDIALKVDCTNSSQGLKTDDVVFPGAPAIPPARWRRCRPYFTSATGSNIYANPVRSQCGPSDAYTHDTDVAGPDSPCDAPGAYPVFWNKGGCFVPNNEKCNATTRDKTPVDVTKFGILPYNWTQTNIRTLEGSMMPTAFQNLMPLVKVNASTGVLQLINGGVPQNGNLSKLVAELRVVVPLWIPVSYLPSVQFI